MGRAIAAESDLGSGLGGPRAPLGGVTAGILRGVCEGSGQGPGLQGQQGQALCLAAQTNQPWSSMLLAGL